MVTSQVWPAPPFLLRSHWLEFRLPRTDVCSLSDIDSCQTKSQNFKANHLCNNPICNAKDPGEKKMVKVSGGRPEADKHCSKQLQRKWPRVKTYYWWFVFTNVWHLKEDFNKIFKAPFPDISPPAMVGGSPALLADPPSSLLFRCLFFLSFWFTTSSAVHVFHCKHSTCFAFDAKLCDSCLCKRTTSLNTSSDFKCYINVDSFQ